MGFVFNDRVRVCSPVTFFEELEERIVLDASIDNSAQDHPFGTDGLNQSWNLEYASNPSTATSPLLDAKALEGYGGTLSVVTMTVDNTPAFVPGGTAVVGLGGRFTVDPDPTPLSNVVVTLVVPPGGGWETLAVTAVGGASVTGSPGTTVSITGPDAAVTASLFTLQGTVTSGFNGHPLVDGTPVILASIFDSADPPSPLAPYVFDAINFDGANDIPFVTAPASLVVNQNNQVAVSGISVTDVDVYNRMLTTEVDSNTGLLNFANTSALNNIFVANPHQWIVEGYLGPINQFLQSLRYTGTQAGTDIVTIIVDDEGNIGNPIGVDQIGTASIAITVAQSAINVTPQVNLPASDTFPGATTHSFGGIWPDPAHVVSALAADQLDVSILVHHGQLGFSSSLPATVTTLISDVDTTGDSQIYLRGPVAALNSALDTLTYLAYPGFTGGDILSISVMDNMQHDGSRNPVQRVTEGSVTLTVT